MSDDRCSLSTSHRDTGSVCKKRPCRTESESYIPQKRRHLHQTLCDGPCTEAGDFSEGAQHLPTQLPSPALTTSDREPNESSLNRAPSKKRKAKSLDLHSSSKRARLFSEPPGQPSSVSAWLTQLPETFKPIGVDHDLEDMNRPPAKRSRSEDSLSRRGSQSGDGSETVVSRDKKYSVYKDTNYSVVLETKGSHMRPSKAGMAEEDRKLCEQMLTTNQPIPPDMLFDDDHFAAFHANLRGRSEARICTDLHPRVMPSVENLAICGREEFTGLIEGHNDPWVKSVPFYGPRPQPDHTYGFKWSNFTEQQRRKLNIEPTKKSYYTAREDVYFPYLTGEVKCGRQGLDLADRPNAHSMTIALRGVVDIYRRANRLRDVHRRALGFSISHDDNGSRIYAHYPEVDGDETTFWRETLREFSFGNDKGKERRTCYQFTLNVCQTFALPFLERLKRTIDALPDPAAQLFGLTAPLDSSSVHGVPDDVSELDSQDEGVKKGSRRRGLDVEIKNMIQSLQGQLAEQQRQSKEQLAEQQRQSREQLAEQQRQSKEQSALLEKQLAEQAALLRKLVERN